MTSLNVAVSALETIRQHAISAAPEECCGLLVGSGNAIQLAIPATNRAGEPMRRYQIDAYDHFAAIRQARTLGLEIIGAYHSHPRSEAVPSETDRAEAFEEFVFVIAGGSEEQTISIRAWQLCSGNFVELPLVCDA